MNEIPSIGQGALPPADSQYTHRSRRAPGPDTGISARSGLPLRRQPDAIELSPTAKRLILLDRIKHDPPVRQELIDRVSAEIADDRYQSSEKIDRVVDELWNDYFAQSDEHSA